MKKQFALLASILVLTLTSCDKETKLKNTLEGRAWNATVETTIDGNTETYTGTYTFAEEEFVYSTNLTDDQGNSYSADNLGYSIGPEAVSITLSDSSGSYEYDVNINEKKLQEWTFSDDINGVNVLNMITLTR